MRGNSVSNVAPTKINDTIQPVININPKDYRRINILVERTSNGSIYTTPNDRDFFLVGGLLSSELNGAGSATSRVTVILKGQTSATTFMRVNLRATALNDKDSQTIVNNLSLPILLERGSAIALANVSTTTIGTICGYVVD